jgi:hypothetical protein
VSVTRTTSTPVALISNGKSPSSGRTSRAVANSESGCGGELPAATLVPLATAAPAGTALATAREIAVSGTVGCGTGPDFTVSRTASGGGTAIATCDSPPDRIWISGELIGSGWTNRNTADGSSSAIDCTADADSLCVGGSADLPVRASSRCVSIASFSTGVRCSSTSRARSAWPAWRNAW